MTTPNPRASLVIPVFGNASTILELHGRLTMALGAADQDIQFIFVDDCSPDEAVPVLTRLAREDPRVMALLLRRNRGQHRAILTGLHFVQGSKTVVMDADLQDPPEEVPRLLRALGGEIHAVFGERYGRYESSRRLLSSRIFKLVQHWMTGVPTRAGTFFAISEVMRARLLMMPRPFGSVVAMIGMAGLPFSSIQIQRSARAHGKSAYKWHRRLSFGARAISWIIYLAVLGGRRHSGEATRDLNATAARSAVREIIGMDDGAPNT